MIFCHLTILKHKLIIVEGLPCSGKSTTAKYIARQLGMKYVDEGTGNHPADYEFHAFLKPEELDGFSDGDRKLIKAAAERKSGGYIVPLAGFDGELFDRLLQHKIYDFLPWEVERPVMLGKWREFADKTAREYGMGYVFNCVLLQNPMCETMLRFGMDTVASAEYIHEIRDIISPLDPFVVYLRSGDIRRRIENALPERGEEWLRGVIDYHCNGAYGKANGLEGFDGYIAALNDRQEREVNILRGLGVEKVVIDDPDKDWDGAYKAILDSITG